MTVQGEYLSQTDVSIALVKVERAFFVTVVVTGAVVVVVVVAVDVDDYDSCL